MCNHQKIYAKILKSVIVFFLQRNIYFGFCIIPLFFDRNMTFHIPKSIKWGLFSP